MMEIHGGGGAVGRQHGPPSTQLNAGTVLTHSREEGGAAEADEPFETFPEKVT